MAVISLEGMEFYAHHGHFDEEQIIGTRFVVDFYFEADTQEAASSDNLHHTIDYQQVYGIIKEEMGIKSKLLEHVTWRMLSRILQTYPGIRHAEVRICKVNPPLGGQVGNVCVTLSSDDLLS